MPSLLVNEILKYLGVQIMFIVVFIPMFHIMAIYLIDLFLLISIFCVYASHPALDDLHANKQYPNVIPAKI
jgi:hypothetical protein